MKAKKRPTIYDVEKATGYSLGTISRAFNQSTRISAQTREHILKTALEIGYSPHPGARTIKLGKTRRLGLLIPHLRNPFYAELMESLAQEARQRNNLLLVGMSDYDGNIESQLIRHWANGEVDGVIIASLHSEIDRRILARIRSGEFPTVFLYVAPAPDCDIVATDTMESSDRAIRHLLSWGHRRIAYLGRQSPSCRETGTYCSYEKITREQGIFDESLVYFGTTYDSRSGAEAWKLWRSYSDPPTAVICFNDIMACWIIHAVTADGLSVPRDLSVIGGDDIAEATRIRLTTVRTGCGRIAKEVFSLLDHPRQEGEPGRRRTVPSDLIMRDSVALPRSHPLPVFPA